MKNMRKTKNDIVFSFVMKTTLFFRKYLAIGLIFALFFPTFLKLHHHHHPLHCDAKGEFHFHNLQHKCEICDFEFSFFEPDHFTLIFEPEPFCSVLNILFCHEINVEPDRYSFLLRAPPSLFPF